MLRKIFVAAAATAALVLCVQSAHAIVLNVSFSITANTNAAAGLEIVTTNCQGTNFPNCPSTLPALNVPNGPPGVFLTPLFELFANESPPFAADDLIPRPISVLFNIAGAAGLTGSGTVNGTTVGDAVNDTGLLQWAGPVDITLSDNTHLTIQLTDTEFGDVNVNTFNGLVFAQFSYVPEPGTLALLAAGLVGVFSLRRRALA